MTANPNSIYTSNGYISLLKPEENEYRIDDIARALSNVCRYSGHTKFYSVAEHSVRVAAAAPRELRMEALLHDMTEAFLGDVATPLKSLLPDYKRIEKRMEAAMRVAFKLPTEHSAEVKELDLRMLATEVPLIFGQHVADEWEILNGVKPLPYRRLGFWEPELGQAQFMHFYNQCKFNRWKD